jgi:hypothetical protein
VLPGFKLTLGYTICTSADRADSDPALFFRPSLAGAIHLRRHVAASRSVLPADLWRVAGAALVNLVFGLLLLAAGAGSLQVQTENR